MFATSSFFFLLITFVVISSTLITTYITATTEPTPFEVDWDMNDDDDDDDVVDINDESSKSTKMQDILEKNLGDILRKNIHGSTFNQQNAAPAGSGEDDDEYYSTNSRNNLKVPGSRSKKQKNKKMNKEQSPDFRRRKRVQSNHQCPDPAAPKIGDKIHLHIPSREHLVPRFTGMRVFAPPHAEYHEDQTKGFRDSAHVVDHHMKSKILYVFDEHVIQGVWPVHDTFGHKHRNLRVVVKDVHVQEDPNDKEGTELCYIKVVPNY